MTPDGKGHKQNEECKEEVAYVHSGHFECLAQLWDVFIEAKQAEELDIGEENYEANDILQVLIVNSKAGVTGELFCNNRKRVVYWNKYVWVAQYLHWHLGMNIALTPNPYLYVSSTIFFYSLLFKKVS